MRRSHIPLMLVIACGYVLCVASPTWAAPIRTANASSGSFPQKAPELLYASDGGGNVFTWNASAPSTPIATMTGFGQADGLAVDNEQNLYVADRLNNVVMVYHRGARAPFLTLTKGLESPTAVAVGNDGTVYVADEAGLVVIYPRGSQNPLGTLRDDEVLKGVAVDAANNVFVMFNAGSGSEIDEFVAGTSNPAALAFSEPDVIFTWGLAQDTKGNFVIPTAPANLHSGDECFVYPVTGGQFLGTFGTPGSTSGAAAFSKKGKILYIAGIGAVTKYKYVNVGHVHPLGAFTGNFSQAVGVALSPRMPLPSD